eukprot:174497_1
MSSTNTIIFLLMTIFGQYIQTLSASNINSIHQPIPYNYEINRRRLRNKRGHRGHGRKHYPENHIDPDLDNYSYKLPNNTTPTNVDDNKNKNRNRNKQQKHSQRNRNKNRNRYDTYTNDNESDSDEQDVGCDDFMRNGNVYGVLQANAAIVLRGINLMSSDDENKQDQGVQLYEQQLYPYMLDSFTWLNTDGGTVISSKEQFESNVLILAQAIPNSIGIESFSYFECVADENLTMIMYFNGMERWDNSSAEVPRKEGGIPERIERCWNYAMYFQYDYDTQQFMIYKVEYDDPLVDYE